MSSLPAPRIDEDSYDIIDDAVAALAERRGVWIGDDTMLIHTCPPALIDQAPATAAPRRRRHGAHENDASRHDIAVLIGASDEEARLRFAADSPIADERWALNTHITNKALDLNHPGGLSAQTALWRKENHRVRVRRCGSRISVW